MCARQSSLVIQRLLPSGTSRAVPTGAVPMLHVGGILSLVARHFKSRVLKFRPVFVKLLDIIFQAFPRAVVHPLAGVLAWMWGFYLTVCGGIWHFCCEVVHGSMKWLDYSEFFIRYTLTGIFDSASISYRSTKQQSPLPLPVCFLLALS